MQKGGYIIVRILISWNVAETHQCKEMQLFATWLASQLYTQLLLYSHRMQYSQLTSQLAISIFYFSSTVIGCSTASYLASSIFYFSSTVIGCSSASYLASSIFYFSSTIIGCSAASYLYILLLLYNHRMQCSQLALYSTSPLQSWDAVQQLTSQPAIFIFYFSSTVIGYSTAS